MFKKNTRKVIKLREGIKSWDDVFNTQAQLTFAEELDDLNMILLNKNQNTIEKFRMMQEAAFQFLERACE